MCPHHASVQTHSSECRLVLAWWISTPALERSFVGRPFRNRAFKRATTSSGLGEEGGGAGGEGGGRGAGGGAGFKIANLLQDVTEGA